MNEELNTYLFTYEHDGAECVLVLKAKDVADAKARVSKIAQATYDGELVTKVPLGPEALLNLAVSNWKFLEKSKNKED